MPAIQSYGAAQIRDDDRVTQHRAGTTHTGVVQAAPQGQNGFTTSLVVACTTCRETETWTLSNTDLVTAERTPKARSNV